MPADLALGIADVLSQRRPHWLASEPNEEGVSEVVPTAAHDITPDIYGYLDLMNSSAIVGQIEGDRDEELEEEDVKMFESDEKTKIEPKWTAPRRRVLKCIMNREGILWDAVNDRLAAEKEESSREIAHMRSFLNYPMSLEEENQMKADENHAKRLKLTAKNLRTLEAANPSHEVPSRPESANFSWSSASSKSEPKISKKPVNRLVLYSSSDDEEFQVIPRDDNRENPQFGESSRIIQTTNRIPRSKEKIKKLPIPLIDDENLSNTERVGKITLTSIMTSLSFLLL